MFTVLDQIRPTFYIHSILDEGAYFTEPKDIILGKMGARNLGQLRLNFGMAILIDSDYLQAIFE